MQISVFRVSERVLAQILIAAVREDRAGQAPRPWRTAEQVELATPEYVDWYNHQRLFETCGDIPPTEFDAAYYVEPPASSRPVSQQTEFPGSPGRFNAPGKGSLDSRRADP